MISCNLNRVKRVLCLGAHSDDIEIGCGGTVLRMIEQSKSIEFYWLVLSSNPRRAKEAERSANAFLSGASCKTVVVKSFRDGFLPYLGPPVKECFEELKKALHARCNLHALPARSSPRPPSGVRVNVEHFSRSLHPRIRDPEIRRRSALTEFFRAVERDPCAEESEEPDAVLYNATEQAVVLRGIVLRSHAAAGHRGRLTHPLRGSFLLSESAARDNELSRVTGVR